MIKERKYTLCFLGFLSFLGFSGLNGNPYNLLWFSFAGYFSYFWWAKLGQIDNESLKKNKSRACVISYRICFVIAFVLSILVKLSTISVESSFKIQIILISVTFAIATNLWAFLTCRFYEQY